MLKAKEEVRQKDQSSTPNHALLYNEAPNTKASITITPNDAKKADHLLRNSNSFSYKSKRNSLNLQQQQKQQSNNTSSFDNNRTYQNMYRQNHTEGEGDESAVEIPEEESHYQNFSVINNRLHDNTREGVRGENTEPSLSSFSSNNNHAPLTKSATLPPQEGGVVAREKKQQLKFNSLRPPKKPPRTSLVDSNSRSSSIEDIALSVGSVVVGDNERNKENMGPAAAEDHHSDLVSKMYY